MIDRLLLFGASGDLAGRHLLPGLAALLERNLLPEPLVLVGAAGKDWDDDGFRAFAAERLNEHAAEVPRSVRERLLDSLRYRRADATDPAAVEATLRVAGTDDPVAVYLALPQQLHRDCIEALAGAGLPGGSRVVIEKPFGEDLASARDLNAIVAAAIPGGENGVFRVDHVLGMATTQTLLARRAEDRALAEQLDGEHIAEVEILWEETLALEGRAGFYDRAGAVKDVVQNHMLQLLAIVAMEPPASLDAAVVRARRIEALRSVAPADPASSRRARYVAGGEVPAYVDEDGVDPGRETETFAELLLEVRSRRWARTRFRLRAGKALARRRKCIVLHFRGSAGEREIDIDGVDGRAPARAELPAYAAVLCDVLSGGSALSVSGEEAELAWGIVDPVLAAWRDGSAPMAQYPAGSDGPQRL